MTTNNDPDKVIHNSDRGFLGDLVSCIQCYPYRGRQQFLVDFEMEQRCHRAGNQGHVSEWFLLSEVDNHTFVKDFLDPVDQRTPWTSWSSYDPHLGLLLIRTTKSLAHETASQSFYMILLESIESKELQRSIRNIGSATHFSSLGAKEPDLAWSPYQLPRGRSRDWPSVVLEIAYSETELKLGSDVRFWIRASGGDVNVVLALRINRQQPEIRIEKWMSNDHNDNVRRHLEQSIKVSKANNRIILSGAPLVIGFEELFLRPASSPGEKNIEIDGEKLQHLATEIWDEQGL